MKGKFPCFNILVVELPDTDERLARQVSLTNISGTYIVHGGGRAGSALLVKRRQQCNALRADGGLRYDLWWINGRKSRLDVLDSNNVRPDAGVIDGVLGKDVHEPGEILGVKQLNIVDK